MATSPSYSGQGVFSPIPSIGNVLLHIFASDVLANRPAADGTKGFYYATDTAGFYIDIGSWIPLIAGSASIVTGMTALTGTVNGVNKVFTVPAPFRVGSLSVFSDGLAWMPGVDYSLSGSTVTAVIAPTQWIAGIWQNA